MIIHRIAEAATSQYRGSGHALAAIVDDAVIAITYVRDILPMLEDEEIAVAFDADVDERLVAAVRSLAERGDVVFGICSGWEIVKLASIIPQPPATVVVDWIKPSAAELARMCAMARHELRRMVRA